MKTLIRLLMEEQCDMVLYNMPSLICPKTLDYYGKLANCLKADFLIETAGVEEEKVHMQRLNLRVRSLPMT